MKTFNQFITERTQYPYLFHGTSSNNRASIKQHGLLSSFESGKDTKQDGVYVTTDFDLAVREAKSTVKGENGEEGQGGSPVVVVIKRDHPSVLKLKFQRDHEYTHPSSSVRKTTAFWAEGSIPAAAIVDIVKATDAKYKSANMPHLTKQAGIFDSEGNPIADSSGGVPELTDDSKLRVFWAGSKAPEAHDSWSTDRHSESLYIDDEPQQYMIIAPPNQFTVVDQMRHEVLVQPKSAAFRKWQRIPKSFMAS